MKIGNSCKYVLAKMSDLLKTQNLLAQYLLVQTITPVAEYLFRILTLVFNRISLVYKKAIYLIIPGKFQDLTAIIHKKKVANFPI